MDSQRYREYWGYLKGFTTDLNFEGLKVLYWKLNKKLLHIKNAEHETFLFLQINIVLNIFYFMKISNRHLA